MPDAKNNLFLYEAIELRAEYDARIKGLKGLLPEARKNRDRLVFHRDEEARARPVRAFDVVECRAELGALSAKKRKLNGAIQRANFDNQIAVADQEMNLAEALELRKAINERIGELSGELGASAYENVVHKENRDIVEGPDRDFLEVRQELEEKRRQFRELNRKLRAAAHEIVVDFRDES
jgi:hypothetical protein